MIKIIYINYYFFNYNNFFKNIILCQQQKYSKNLINILLYIIKQGSNNILIFLKHKQLIFLTIQ